jgi:hypothetical protein
VVDRSLELDQRMSLVVESSGQSLTALAEVCIVADDALVSHTLDVRLLRVALAKRTIAIDAVVRDGRGRAALEVLVDGSEAVTRMGVASVLVALAAVVEVGAVEALVAHTMNHLVTAIADGGVSEVATGGKKSLLGEGEGSTIDGRLEVMSRVMAVRVKHVAVQADIVVVTLEARDKVAVGEGHDTGIASAGRLGQGLDVIVEGSRKFLDSVGLGRRCRSRCSGRLGLGSDTLCGTADKLAILDGALDQPVTFSQAGGTLLDASLAEVVVAAFAGAAVIVGVIHYLIASIAEDSPRAFGHVDWLSNTEWQVVLGALSDRVCCGV